MANKNLFKSLLGRLVPRADATNEHGAPAYSLGAKHALAQVAATGCLTGTFYAGAEVQLDRVLALASEVDATFVAKTALHARSVGRMKDMPALLLAVLASKDGTLLDRVFDRVVDDGRMLRNFVQIIRSGTTGRKSLGSRPKRLVRRWLEAKDGDAIVHAAIGNDPSLADVVKMVHPRPKDPARAALYGWLLERNHDASLLPASAQALERFRSGATNEVPDVPLQYLAARTLDRSAWTAIAKQAPWQTLRMNLNTFRRHGVLDDEAVAAELAAKLADPVLVRRARAFPYQLLAAYRNAHSQMPRVLVDALHAALEIATENVPAIDGKLVVAVDVSGSMSSPVTGHRGGGTTSVECIDVAALVAAVMLRANPSAEVLAFSDDIVPVRLELRDTVMTNAAKLAALPRGGTNVSAPLRLLNECGERADLIVIVSDNQSWVDVVRSGAVGTETLRQWSVFKGRNERARLVLIDLQPYATTQAQERDDILNVGGFSDAVFDVIAEFARDGNGARRFVERVEAIEL